MKNKMAKKNVDDILGNLKKKLQSSKSVKEILSFTDYLELVRKEPWITRNTQQLIHDMIKTSGTSYKFVSGNPIRQEYNFFTDKKFVNQYVVFGQEKAKGNLVEKLSNSAKGLEASKRLWILLGPPGSAKSRSMDALKSGLKFYSESEEGKTYTLLLPTIDKRLASKAILTDNKTGIMYLPAPCFETPLQIFPQDVRESVLSDLNNSIDTKSMEKFYDDLPHYDNHFKIESSGLMSPYANKVLEDFMEAKNIDLVDALKYVKVKRMIFDSKSKNGIGSYTPRDEKSQEAGSLVGNIDYSLLPQFGSESHPLVHDYQGELCRGANGFVEIHEILKLSDKFLYELLFATQDRFFKPEGQAPIPFNGVIIGHTNFHEYEMFIENQAFEALRSRTTFIEMPLSTNYKEEQKIYELTYSNEKRDWNSDRTNIAHVAPHLFELLSIIGVMSRMKESKKNPNVNLLQKALMKAGRSDHGHDNQMAKTMMEEFEYSVPAEGTFGLDPRFLQNVFERAEHFQINEFNANKRELEKHDSISSEAVLTMHNPCISPVDLYIQLEQYIKEIFANDKTTLTKYQAKVLPIAKEWILGQITSDVYSAILKDNTVVENTWKKYTDHIKAYIKNTTVKHEVTLEDNQPDEKFMQTIERYLKIPDKDVFRKELSDAIAAVKYDILLKKEPSYDAAIKKYIFENEFRSKENTKLLGWISAGSSDANSNSDEKSKFNETVDYLIKEHRYCNKCAVQALKIAATSQSIS
jgi:serine protein kinase